MSHSMLSRRPCGLASFPQRDVLIQQHRLETLPFRAICSKLQCSKSSRTPSPSVLGGVQISKCRFSRLVVCATSAEAPLTSIPESQEEAVRDAVKAAVSQAQPMMKTVVSSKKGFSKARKAAPVLGIEIPTADDSPQTVANLSSSIAAGLRAELKAAVTLVVPSQDSIASKAPAGCTALGLREACRRGGLTGVVVVSGPQLADIALVEQLLQESWDGPAAVIVNPGWLNQAIPEEYKPLVDSVQTVYSFLPVSIQGLLNGKEGAVVRCAEKGTGAAATWRILMKDGERFVQIAQTKKRPSNDDLQLAFMNAQAAASPLTKTVKFFKGVVDSAKPKK